MIEERLEAAGGGEVTLIDPPTRISGALANTDRSATSWVMVTPGRIPPWGLEGLGRSGVAALSAVVGVLTEPESTDQILASVS